jgi:hypothetical protein
VRCKSLVILNESMICNNAHYQSMGVRIWLADSVVAMTLCTYLCEVGEGLSSLDLTSINDKPSVAMFVSQIGGGIKVSWY